MPAAACCATCCGTKAIQIGRKHVTHADDEDGHRGAVSQAEHQPAGIRRIRIYPYLLRDLTIDRPNHVWAADITYIPMRRGFVYLFAVIDWASRRVLSWRLSNTLTTDFCLEAVQEAIARYGTPEIFNTDQGCQFTSQRVHRTAERQRHPDQHGRQRLLARQRVRGTAVEERQIRGGLSARLRHRVAAAKAGLAAYLTFYNTRRPHQSLDGKTPDTIYFDNLLPRTIAA